MDIDKKSIEEISSQIEKIKKLDLEHADFGVVHNNVNDLMGEYTTVQFPAFNNTIYRVRPNLRNKSGQFELFEYVKNLWAPEPKDMSADKFGRANKPGCSVFYCSNNEKTAIFEATIQEGSWLTVMHCRNKKDLSILKSIGMGFRSESVFGSNDGRSTIKWGDYKRKKIREQYRNEYAKENLVEECCLKNSLIDDFLNKEFSKQVDIEHDFEYKTTAAIAGLYLANPLSENLDGIAYPSVRTLAPNWVFTVEAANKFFSPFYFETYEVSKIMWEGNHIDIAANCKSKSSEKIYEYEDKIEWIEA